MKKIHFMGAETETYTFDEAYAASLDYFTGDELAAKVWVNKYALKDAYGNIYEQSPADMHRRLAREIARVERKYPNPLTEDQLFELFDHFRYIVPQGSPMTGIGNDHQIASLSNCFVIGVEGNADSYGAVIRIDEEQVQLMKRRGGVGHDLSHIRPKGSPGRTPRSPPPASCPSWSAIRTPPARWRRMADAVPSCSPSPSSTPMPNHSLTQR